MANSRQPQPHLLTVILAIVIAAGLQSSAFLSLALAQTPTVPNESAGVITVRGVLHGKNRQLIKNLTREQFCLFQDGKEQQIAHFSQADQQPLNIGLLMQWSGARRVELPYGEILPAANFFRSLL